MTDASLLGPSRGPLLRHHHRRIRLHARVISWALAPLVILLLILWLFYNAVACWGDYAPPAGEVICRYGQAVPELPIVLVVLDAGLFLIALSDFVEEMLARPRLPGEWRIVHGFRHSRHAYRNLDEDVQSTMLFSLEMMLWAAGTILAIQIYYWTNNAWLFGVLALAAVVRVVHLLYRGVRRLLRI
jgi:hypothetical protein